MSRVPAPALQDCWNQVGVWGDSTCPRLAEVAHCRHCPVYASASARLLHGEPPADYLREWTQRLARPRPAAEAAKTLSVMIFRLGAEWFALPAAVFQEVAEPRPVHSLPHRRGKILRGLVNIRGELIVCVSLGGALHVAEDAASGAGRERLLVVATPEGRLAFTVAEVHGIEPFAPDQLQPVPETLALASARFTRGLLTWNGRPVGCVDDARLFETLNRSLG
ncbi:MAG: purine-binding chemotaxis protein CheW [Caulobacteraceae bacterium]|nr:purine-binding chemotaxis protein CheW [Caulobacter sp.]